MRRDELARLVREHLLAGHLIDRAGMPHVLAAHGPEGMGEVAIGEWMGASPLYSRRMRALLAIDGDDVESIFKGMQLDVGAPPQFMDFRYEVRDPNHGAFRLASCGALLDAEPMGEEIVHLMCHTIEDPTMDATAWATNPRARMRPLHRPPRMGDHHPEHCWWEVDIDPAREPVPEPAPVAAVAATQLAQLPIAQRSAGTGDSGGRTHYDGSIEPDLDLAAFDASTLEAIDDEVCLQGHLLVLSFSIAVTERWGEAFAREVGVQQLVGTAGVVAERLVRAFALGADDEAMATLLALHPALRPGRYTGARVERDPDGVPVLRIAADAPALAEVTPGAWLALLVDEASGAADALDAIVAAADPRARMERADAAAGDAAAWRLVRDREPLPEPGSVSVVRFSTGAEFRFDDR